MFGRPDLLAQDGGGKVRYLMFDDEFRHDAVQRCQRFLEPGEVVRYVFAAKVGISVAVWDVVLVPMRLLFASERRLVCVTDRALVMIDADRKWLPKRTVGRLPRQVRLGPVSGTWGSLAGLGGGLYVHLDFHREIAAADYELDLLHRPGRRAPLWFAYEQRK